MMKRTALASALAVALAVAPAARAHADPDPWFARDKAEHFVAETWISAIGYDFGAALFRPRWAALLAGAGSGVTAGAGYELYKSRSGGDPSWRDFTWDLIGTATGTLISCLIDLAIR